MSDDNLPCKMLKRKLRYKGRAFSVYEYTSQVGERIVKRDIIERKDGVVAVPVDVNGNVYLLSEYCAGSNSFVLSLPGGKMDSKSSLDAAGEAERELREETGFRARQMIKLHFAWSHPSTSSRRSFAFLAYDLIHDPLPASKNEIIRLVILPLEEALLKVGHDFDSDVSTVGNLLMARDKLRELGVRT